MVAVSIGASVMLPQVSAQSKEQIEESFSHAEANVQLEGFDPYSHPLYAKLKQQVIDGEISSEQMSDAIVAFAASRQLVTSAA